MKKSFVAIRKRKQRSDQRRALAQALGKALKMGDLEAAQGFQEQLELLAPKSNGRSSSSICRDPYDPELLELYKDKLVHEILAEFGKEIRVDFGFLGIVAGLAGILDAGCEAVGENIGPSLRKELTRRFARKFVERTHGMGMLYTERANQVIRKLHEQPEVVKALGLPMGERPWVKRRPLSEQVDFDADFARRWEDFEALGIDTEGTEDPDSIETNADATDVSKAEPAKAEAVAEDTMAGDARAVEQTDSTKPSGRSDDGRPHEMKTDTVETTERTEPTKPAESAEPTDQTDDSNTDDEKTDDSPDPSKLDLKSLLE